MKIQFRSDASSTPDRDQGIKVPYAPAKRRVFQWRWHLILLIVCSPLLFFFYKLALSYILISGPGYVSLNKLAVNATATGNIETILVNIGEDLRLDQPLVQLENNVLTERERLIRAKLDSISQDALPPPQSIMDLLIDKTRLAGTLVARQQEQMDQLLFLRKQGAATAAEIEAATARRDRALIVLNEAQQELAAFQERSERYLKDTEQLTSSRMHLQAELESLQAALKRLVQRCSIAGRVLEIYAEVGETVGPGAPLLLLGRSAEPEIIAYLDPKNTAHASKGSTANVLLPNGEKLKAVVRETPRLSSRLPANLTSPIGSRNMMLLVKLDFMELPSSYHWVDGLPVTVRFNLF